MSCPPKRNSPPLRKPEVPAGHIELRLNRHFDSEKELTDYLKAFYPENKGYKIFKREVMFAEIIIPEICR